MTHTSDGDLIFNTGLDNSGFDKESDALLQSINRLCDTVEKIGSRIAASFEQCIPSIQAVGQAVQAVNSGAAENASEQAQTLSGISESANSSRSAVSGLERDIRGLSAQTDRLSNASMRGFTNANAVLSFDAQIRKAEESLASLRRQLAAFADAKIPTADYTRLNAEIAKAENGLYRLYSRQDDMRSLGVSEQSKQWQSLALKIQNAEQLLAQYESQRDALEKSGGAFMDGRATQEYADADSELSRIAATLERNKSLIESEEIAQARLNVLTAQEAVYSAQSARERERALANLATAQDALRKAAEKSIPSPDPQQLSFWGQFASYMSEVSSQGKALIWTLGRLPLSVVSKSAQLLGGRMRHLASSFTASNNGAAGLIKSLTSIKTLMLTRLKRMFISEIFSGIGTAMNNLALYSSTFGSAMANIKNSSKELSGNLAVTFGNLISVIEPIVTRIISALSTAVSYINAFMSMLGGGSAMVKASKQTGSYADNLNDAAGGAKKLNSYLAGFDELNKLNDNSGGGGGFSTGAIEDALSGGIGDWAEKLKQKILSENWFGVGYTIAEGLNSAMSVVDDWINNTLNPLGVKWADNFARVLNGIVYGLDWGLIGKTIADGFNTVADIFESFTTRFDFKKLGSSISTELKSLFDSLGQNAQTWGKSLYDIVMGMWMDVLYGMSQNTEWISSAATWIGDGLESAVKSIEWSKIGETVSGWASGIAEGIMAFVDSVDWQQLATDLATGLGDMLASVDWPKVLAAFAGAATALVGGIVSFILGGLSGLSDQLARLFSSVGADGIAGLFKGISDALSDVAAWIKSNLIDPILSAVKNFLGIHSPSTVFAELGGFMVDGLKNGLTSAWTEITSFFTSKLSDVKTSVTNAWNTIKANTSTTWSSIKSSVVSAWNTMSSNAATQMQSLVSNVSSKWNGLKSTLTSANWTSVGSNLVNGLKNGISNGWGMLSDLVSNLANNLTNRLKNAFSVHSPSRVWEQIGSFLDAGLFNGIQSGEKSLLSMVSDFAESITGRMTPEMPDFKAWSVSSNQAISDMLSRMNGLQMPEIAAGTVIPYQVRIDDSGVAYGRSDSTLDDVVGSSVAGFESISNLLMRLIEVVGSIDIGDSTIANAASRYQTKMAIVQGGTL